MNAIEKLGLTVFDRVVRFCENQKVWKTYGRIMDGFILYVLVKTIIDL